MCRYQPLKIDDGQILLLLEVVNFLKRFVCLFISNLRDSLAAVTALIPLLGPFRTEHLETRQPWCLVGIIGTHLRIVTIGWWSKKVVASVYI